MADPRPPTRDELAKFLPNQRALRAFEKLFDIIPSELGGGGGASNLALVSSQGDGGANGAALELIDVAVNFTTYAPSFLNVTSQVLITLNPTPENAEQVVVHKNTGGVTDYVEVTDGVGTDRLLVDQTVISYRYSVELNQWVRGS